jgi:hypothetical protein
MTQSYRAFLEAAVDRLVSEGSMRAPSDLLVRAASQGFCTDAFETDVEEAIREREFYPSLMQLSLYPTPNQ